MHRTLALLLILFWIPARAAEGPPVVVANVALKEFPLTIEAIGNARANESVDIRPEVVERVAVILFEEGQKVTAGQTLVELENTEALASVAEHRAALVESNSQVRRARELLKTKSVSASETEQLTARRDADRAALDAAEARLADTVIRAPFAGTLGLRRISPGSLVSPDTVITTLDDTDVIKLDFDVPETALAKISKGLSVTARSAAWQDEIFEGVVVSIDTRVDPVSRTVTVRANVPNPEARLRPGMFLTVVVQKDNIRALTIPEQAVMPEGSKQYVLVLDANDIVEKREIRTGRRRPGEVEILAGLVENERVIAEGTQSARPGKSVRIVRTM